MVGSVNHKTNEIAVAAPMLPYHNVGIGTRMKVW